MSELRFENHNSDIIKEFYNLNKYLITEQLKDSLIDAYECLDYVEKYKWHDLKKYPNDLPKIEGDVFAWAEHYEGKRKLCDRVSYYGEFDIGNNWEVIAWKYIEPFEEGEE